ncbi:MAG: hypothetical protein J6C98_09610 [Oscillospiraceae bacterium]|nr:hypothetical protein [Oscillospiraceae bacterium]
MLVARLFVSRAEIEVRRLAPITAGMVGARVEAVFDSTWDGYAKTFVWCRDKVTSDDTAATGKIPASVLAQSGGQLRFGVYGTKDGQVLPTLWATIGAVNCGTDPSGDESTDPELPVWAQLHEQMQRVDERVSEMDKTVAAAVKTVNGAAPDENGNVQIDAVSDEELAELLAALEVE